MAQYNVEITNSSGQENILTGTYNVTSNTVGYDNTSIEPSSVVIVNGTTNYNFTVSATGSLTLHVTEDGTSSGTPIVGATFVRTDSSGTQYGDAITTNETGNAVFEHVPFDQNNAPIIYYKQLSSDGAHEYSSEVLQTSLTTSSQTLEIENASPALVTINLTDGNYENLPITASTLTLEN